MSFYTTSDFDTGDLGPIWPIRIPFDKAAQLHKALAFAVKEIQRSETSDPRLWAKFRHSWRTFCIAFCIASLGPELAHTHYLKAYLYHVRNRLWLQ